MTSTKTFESSFVGPDAKVKKSVLSWTSPNVLDSGFLERMNTLLANAEVPGLFEGDEHAALMTACKEGSQRDGLMLDSHEELYRWFTQQVARNLHVVFTMNPPENGLASRAAHSPALFNRCVLDWFGDWSDQAFYQVGMEFTHNLDLDLSTYTPPVHFPIAYRGLSMPPIHRTAVVNALVHVHSPYTRSINACPAVKGDTITLRPVIISICMSSSVSLTSRTDPHSQLASTTTFVYTLKSVTNWKNSSVTYHVGLDKLRDTVTQVEELRKSLAIKRSQLEAKDAGSQ